MPTPCPGKGKVKWTFDFEGMPKGIEAVGVSKCAICSRTALQFVGEQQSEEECLAFIETVSTAMDAKGDLKLSPLPKQK